MERIAKVYSTAVLNPTKAEILHQQFGPVTNIGAFRFVDPNGKVGIETLLVRETDGALLQFPVTYREQRISDTHEVGTTEHSHLGTRHITKIVADPVAVTEIIRVILEGDTNVQRSDGKTSPYEIRGTGTAGVDTLTLGNIHLKKDRRHRGHWSHRCQRQPQSLLAQPAHPSAGHPGGRRGQEWDARNRTHRS